MPPKGAKKGGSKKGKEDENTQKRKQKSVKQRIRDVKRLLRKPDLDPEFRASQEVALRKLEQESKKGATVEKEKKYARAYHMVRFFERRKLLRKIKQCCARIAAATEKGSDTKTLEQELQTMKDKYQYVVHFPKGRKYISLFPKGEVTPETAREREMVRSQIMGGIATGSIKVEEFAADGSPINAWDPQEGGASDHGDDDFFVGGAGGDEDAASDNDEGDEVEAVLAAPAPARKKDKRKDILMEKAAVVDAPVAYPEPRKMMKQDRAERSVTGVKRKGSEKASEPTEPPAKRAKIRAAPAPASSKGRIVFDDDE